jgi:hypothetical protein
MNANQIINMVLRIFMNKAIRGGMDAGMKAMQKRQPQNREGEPEKKPVPGPGDQRKRMQAARRIGRF